MVLMPTLQDVAKRAGVSTATVSKVLSNKPYFTEETRDKVMKAVAELGYVPHLAARALSSGRTGIIAVVFPYLYDMIFSDPLVLRILEGIESEASQRGYAILLSTPKLTDHGPDPKYHQLITSGYIDGMITLDNVPFASVTEPASRKGIPAVAIGYYETPYTVQSDDYSGGVQLMRHVTALGHRHIGIISVPERLHYAIHYRLDGLRAAAEEANLDFDSVPRADGDFSTASGSKGAACLLEQHPDLTAIICLNDRMAIGAIQAAKQAGREVPADLSVVGYDDIPMAAAITPPLTTIDQQAPELGRAAARMLFEVIDNRAPASVRLSTALVVRESSAAVQPYLERR